MSLPQITVPGSLPAFLVEHEIEQGDVFASVPRGTGSSRKRAVSTAQLQRRSVEWFLTDAQMQTADAWFENSLLAGALQFSALLPNQGPGKRWWAARWGSPWQATPTKISIGRVWRVSGQLVLSGAGSITGPANTSLSLELDLALAASASIVGVTLLALELSLKLQRAQLLVLELSIRVDSIQNSVPASSTLRDRRWVWLRFPDSRAQGNDITDPEAIRRNWAAL